ncbi:acyltransferase family protein [Turicibacter sanguinis]|uniref:acyltransferase family protein n=1 Tax=Turicibacter sanguinis TaxID=154288 RepID=UPI0018AA1540|nr:acyltransferase family protein [Turicibacter sanguinis]MDB8558412.1 acyltransferase family protein [Turicibacter sanguinis]MDB8561208.1 acyltransferase family protein [Turicibacter sanguinis]
MNIKHERILYFDIAKGFAMILIVLGHIYNNDNLIKIWMHSFHVPIFFIISGMVIRHTKLDQIEFKEIIVKKIKSLIVPYFYFELLAITLYMLMNGFSFSILKWNIIDSILLYSRANGTWFLICLFGAELIFILIKKITSSDWLTILISLLLFIIPFEIKINNHWILIFFRMLIANGFLCFGYYCYWLVKNINLKLSILFLILVITGIMSINNELVGIHGLTFNNPYIYIICAFIESLTYIFIFKNINAKFLKYIGQNSLIILGTHGCILTILSMVPFLSFETYTGGGVVLVITLFIEIAIIYLMNNYLYWFCGNKNTVYSNNLRF